MNSEEYKSMKPRSCVLVINNFDDILLMHRVKDGREYWVFPGGSIEDGETPLDAAIREALEETSLTVTGLSLAFEQDNDGRHEYYFSVNSFTGSVKLGNGPERQKQNDKNTYEPVWVSTSKARDINLLPVSAKIKVLDFRKCETHE